MLRKSGRSSRGRNHKGRSQAMSAKDIERLVAVIDDLVVSTGAGSKEEAVRAVLQALRDPSEETVKAGSKVMFDALPVWQAMIDHLLAD